MVQTLLLKTKEEKEEFLENDFIDRLIRIEQRISAKFGKLIGYKQSYCYKSLTPENRRRYERYLKMKKKKKFAFATSFFLPLLGILFLSNSFTGNAIKDSFGKGAFGWFFWFFLASLSFSLIALGVFFLIRLQRERRFGLLFKPLEEIAIKKKNL